MTGQKFHTSRFLFRFHSTQLCDLMKDMSCICRFRCWLGPCFDPRFCLRFFPYIKCHFAREPQRVGRYTQERPDGKPNLKAIGPRKPLKSVLSLFMRQKRFCRTQYGTWHVNPRLGQIYVPHSKNSHGVPCSFVAKDVLGTFMVRFFKMPCLTACATRI
jgi:hypothetical protein